MTESVLIFQLRVGNEKAVERWYSQYVKKLLRFILTKVSQPRDAEEICQDTFLACLESLPLFKGNASLWTWMCSVARHEIADYFRKKYAKKLITMVPFSDVIIPGQFFDVHGVSRSVKNVLSQLSFSERELLLLKYVDNVSVKHIACRMGVSFKSAESALFRAKKAFQTIYAKSEEYA